MSYYPPWEPGTDYPQWRAIEHERDEQQWKAKERERARQQGRRDKDAHDSKRDAEYQAREVSSDTSFDVSTAIAGLALFLTFGTGGIGTAVALASLRVATATFYGAAAGGVTIGTGYVVVKRGQLVVQKAKPGAIATIRAANRAVRDARSIAQNAAHDIAATSDGLRSAAARGTREVVHTGAAVGDHVITNAGHIGDHIVRWLPGYRTLLDPQLAGQGQSHLDAVQTIDLHLPINAANDLREGDILAVFETEDGMLELQRLDHVVESDLAADADQVLPLAILDDQISEREPTPAIHHWNDNPSPRYLNVAQQSFLLDEWEQVDIQDGDENEDDFIEIPLPIEAHIREG